MFTEISQEIRSVVRDPRKALAWVVLRPEEYGRVFGELKDTCNQTVAVNLLEKHMTKDTDIHEHLLTLYMLTVERRLGRILELGTRTGESTVALLLAARDVEGSVTSVDIDPCLEAKRNIRESGLDKYWTFIQADDLPVQWSSPIDHLFIDTSHTFEQTLRELQKYEPYVVSGGIVTLHDTVSNPEVLRAIRLYAMDKPHLKVYQYFNCNGLAVIIKKQS